MQDSSHGRWFQAPASAPGRVESIEGLRGYLALWVLVSHVLMVTGIENVSLSGLGKLLRQGDLAVNVFIVVSGFAIFMCLDTQTASYRQFVVRRFWRLFPLFLVMFAASIPLSLVDLWNTTHATQFLPQAQIDTITREISGWWDKIQWHVPLHLLMLHGIVPDVLLVDAPGAFLGPAWSVSLEWQFYLLAPLAYALSVHAKPSRRLMLLATCVLLYVAARRLLPTVRYGAALPFHVEYFVLGAASYFLYKHRARLQRPRLRFALAMGTALLLMSMHQGRWFVIPLALWAAFMGVLLAPASSWPSRLTMPVFTNPLGRYLGRISYSIYLSHLLVIGVMQNLLLVWAPELGRAPHFVLLLASTLAVTVAVSSLSHRYIEVPGVRFGRSLARPLSDQGTRNAVVDTAAGGTGKLA
jgi:peptidoglycan/LPS O-acetylase OafA/YrhL